MAQTKNKGVRYSFEGQYYTGSKDLSEQVKLYSLDVIFPEATPKALALFKTSLNRQVDGIYKLMVSKYPDFKRARTMTITNIVDLSGGNSGSKSVATMNVKQLKAYIAKKELDIDVDVYDGNITALREIIVLAEENPEKFKEVYAADVEAYNFNKSINDLNGVPDNNGSDEGSTEQAPSNTSVKKDDVDNEVDAANLLGLGDGSDDEGNDDA